MTELQRSVVSFPLPRILRVWYSTTEDGRDRPLLPGSDETAVKHGRLASVLREPEQLPGPYEQGEPGSHCEDGPIRRERSVRCKRAKSM